MTDGTSRIQLTAADLRTVAGFAVDCARPALAIFEGELPGDGRPRAAVDAAGGSERTKALRDRAWDAQRAAQQDRDAGLPAAAESARAAPAAAGAAFLHPLAKATQVKHILGAAAHAARAFEISAGDHPAVGLDGIARARALAPPHLAEVLERLSAGTERWWNGRGVDADTGRIPAATAGATGPHADTMPLTVPLAAQGRQ